MQLRRWRVLGFALGIGGVLIAADDAGADVTHDHVATTFAGGGAHALVIQRSKVPLSVAPPCSRVRGRAHKPQDEETVTLDTTDPWTGDEVPKERIAAPTRRPLDNIDPWNGESIIVAPASAIVRLDAHDPYTAD